jgi:hypothetical protein
MLPAATTLLVVSGAALDDEMAELSLQIVQEESALHVAELYRLALRPALFNGHVLALDVAATGIATAARRGSSSAKLSGQTRHQRGRGTDPATGY